MTSTPGMCGTYMSASGMLADDLLSGSQNQIYGQVDYVYDPLFDRIHRPGFVSGPGFNMVGFALLSWLIVDRLA